ncbi:MAG: dimethyl sulfoxide reductase anchor subunit [Burkholderiales bacterium]|nr:dimethyl sulfoxide reductase anchor subunit [Burkholderiales bacterium]
MNEVRQGSWDARAAANFIGGGIGCGTLLIAAVFDVRGEALTILVLAGLALVAAGLLAVFAEIGRPLRAMNVLRHARRSWMTREALVAPPLFLVSAAAAYTGNIAMVALMGVLAFAFVYCQARILRAAKGIPAWREPALTPFLLATSLAEGAGVFWLGALAIGTGGMTTLVAFGGLVVLRLFAWLAYRRRAARHVVPAALVALDRAGRVLRYVGTLLPLFLIALVGSGIPGQLATLPLAALAGLAAVVAGAWVKADIVLRASFNQGYAVPHLPVRGVRI